MKRALAISVIALVAVVMGVSAIAPMIPEAVAGHGYDLWPSACDTLRSIPNPPSVIVEMIEDHCNTF